MTRGDILEPLFLLLILIMLAGIVAAPLLYVVTS
jgi:hypothetical protein